MIFNYNIFQAYSLYFEGVFAFQCTRSSGNMRSTRRKGHWCRGWKQAEEECGRGKVVKSLGSFWDKLQVVCKCAVL